MPEITKNLISISRLLHNNDINAEFQNLGTLLRTKNKGKFWWKYWLQMGYMSCNKVFNSAMAFAFLASESISYINNPASMLSFNFSSNDLVEWSITDESSNSGVPRVAKKKKKRSLAP